MKAQKDGSVFYPTPTLRSFYVPVRGQTLVWQTKEIITFEYFLGKSSVPPGTGNMELVLDRRLSDRQGFFSMPRAMSLLKPLKGNPPQK